MIPRPVANSMVAMLAVFSLQALAQTPAPAVAPAPAVPAHNCVAPPYPSKEKTEHLRGDAFNKTIETFNRDYKAYDACIKKYIDDTKALIKAAADATNQAIEEYNKYNAYIKEQVEADKK